MSIYGEIHVTREPVKELFESLTEAERVFVYYMFRASLPFNRIVREQNHRYTNDVIAMFEYVYKKIDRTDPLSKQVETYLVYLWTNHSVYFMREGSKRTPTKFISEEILRSLLTDYPVPYDHLVKYVYEETDEGLVVDGSIESSRNNYYGPGFTKEHYDSLSTEDKTRINAYPFLDQTGAVKVAYHSVRGKYGNELTVAVHWLLKALKHAAQYPNIFDIHIINSLQLLIEYFETGEELKYKQHSVEWLKTNSRIDYVAGFIEQYDDPMGVRGAAAAEVTIKLSDTGKLNPILLEMEQRMPIPDEYKKAAGDKTVLNVSVNGMLFGSGENGPQVLIAAYCLPNYNDIRTEVGSKQIIYKLPRYVTDKTVAKQFTTTRRSKFIEKYDPNNKLYDDLWDVQVLLHETSHASGKFHKHTFKEITTLGDKTYNPGDIIDVTDDNYSLFIVEDSSSLEELRAEINSLYMSIAEIDTLNKEGVYKDWVDLIGIEELGKECVINMCRTIFDRYLTQSKNMISITGAHARANAVITNYLLDAGGIKIVDEVKVIDGSEYHVLDIDVINMDKAMISIVELVQLVQRIKSTGDTNSCKSLFELYTNYPITIEEARVYQSYVLSKKQKLNGTVKTTSRIFPMYTPITLNGTITDVSISDTDIVTQNFTYNDLILSTD